MLHVVGPWTSLIPVLVRISSAVVSIKPMVLHIGDWESDSDNMNENRAIGTVI